MNVQNKIAFWGCPPPDLIEKYKKLYPEAEWFDLDLDFGHPESKLLPDAYCKIIKNIITNSLYYRDEIIAILAPIGKDKCDSGWFASELLKDLGFEVVQCKFEEKNLRREPLISTSALPLREKVELITASIVKPHDKKLVQCKPTFGFWGVPPNDLSILELFPDTTHVYGWTRCVDANVPADIELEMFVDTNVATVFYSQAFCAKAQLAKYLADKYNGLYIDIDDRSTNSVKAKIEAFIELR